MFLFCCQGLYFCGFFYYSLSCKLIQMLVFQFCTFSAIFKVLKNLATQQTQRDDEMRLRIVRPCGICSFYLRPKRNINEIVEQIAMVHDELCDACAFLESYFSAQMLTTVAIAFLIIVFNT